MIPLLFLFFIGAYTPVYAMHSLNEYLFHSSPVTQIDRNILLITMANAIDYGFSGFMHEIPASVNFPTSISLKQALERISLMVQLGIDESALSYTHTTLRVTVANYQHFCKNRSDEAGFLQILENIAYVVSCALDQNTKKKNAT